MFCVAAKLNYKQNISLHVLLCCAKYSNSVDTHATYLHALGIVKDSESHGRPKRGGGVECERLRLPDGTSYIKIYFTIWGHFCYYFILMGVGANFGLSPPKY